MGAELVRLYFGGVDGWLPGHAVIHGYAVKHPKGLVLVDTGMPVATAQWSAGALSRERRLMVRAIDDVLADHDLSVADVDYLVHTHLDLDHCGQNAALPDVPVFVQAIEYERAKRRWPQVPEFFDWMRTTFELLDGDTEILPGLHALFTPGHTEGHQSVLVDDGRSELIVGDAAYTDELWEHPELLREGHDLWVDPADFRDDSGQVRTDYATWRSSLDRLRGVDADAVHLCHSPTIFKPLENGGRSQ